jgi:hypothetical protein
MPKKPKKGKDAKAENDLWIAPRYSLKGPAGERAWDNRPGGPPSNSRFLELADLALGLKKLSPKKGHPASIPTHETIKKEPYLGASGDSSRKKRE